MQACHLRPTNDTDLYGTLWPGMVHSPPFSEFDAAMAAEGGMEDKWLKRGMKRHTAQDTSISFEQRSLCSGLA